MAAVSSIVATALVTKWLQGRKEKKPIITQNIFIFFRLFLLSSLWNTECCHISRPVKTLEMRQYENSFSEGKLLFGWAASTFLVFTLWPSLRSSQADISSWCQKKKIADVEENEPRCVCRHLCSVIIMRKWYTYCIKQWQNQPSSVKVLINIHFHQDL